MPPLIAPMIIIMYLFFNLIYLFEFQNLYDKEIDELNKEAETVETISKHDELKIESQIDNFNEKLKQITSANARLEMELNKKKIKIQ